jgi:poly-gamma-glutamate synthesis protein (capsule biosynthesis protein)
LKRPIENPPQKAGPLLYNSSLPDIPKLSLVLANNHLMDYGNAGLEETMNCIKERGASFSGAGFNKVEARKGMIIEEDGVRFGVISCCEHQFGEASSTLPGVATYGPWIYQTIRELKKKCDYLIVSVHAGMEMAPIPTPYLRELYKSYVDAGADLIHGHHAHRVQGIENYKGAMICYGLGNFAVPQIPWEEKPNTLWSLAVRVNPDKLGEYPEILVYQIKFSASTRIVELLNETETTEKLQFFESLNKVFSDDDFYSGVWQEVALRAYDEFGKKFMGWSNDAISNTSLKALLKAKLMVPPVDKKKETWNLLLKRVMLSCDSHKYMLETALSLRAGEISDLRNNEIKAFCDSLEE